jgi:6-phosphofructokinase 2
VKTVCTLTLNPAIDISTAVAQVAPDRKLRCDRPRIDPGGGGINVARVIRRLGGACVAFYAAGGHTGRLLRDLVDAEGVEQRPIEIAGSTREDVTVTDRGDGRQYRFVMAGPVLAEAEWKRCLEVVLHATPAPDYIVASGSLPEGVPSDFYARLARAARERQARLVLDTSGEALRAAAAEQVYLLKPNRREAEQLVGRPLRDPDELTDALHQFVSGGHAEAVVVSLGAEGALLVTRDGTERLAAPEVTVQSRIGAGDSMVAGIVLGLARGDPLRQAVLLGLAAGSATVMAAGTGLCRAADVERLYRTLTAVHAAPATSCEDNASIPGSP